MQPKIRKDFNRNDFWQLWLLLCVVLCVIAKTKWTKKGIKMFNFWWQIMAIIHFVKISKHPINGSRQYSIQGFSICRFTVGPSVDSCLTPRGWTRPNKTFGRCNRSGFAQVDSHPPVQQFLQSSMLPGGPRLTPPTRATKICLKA